MQINDTNILVKALSATRSAVTITDCAHPDNPIIYCNEAFLNLTKYKREDVIGRNCRFLQGKGTTKASIKKISDSLKKFKDCRVVIKNYTADGEEFWNDLMISPVFDAAGKPTHFIGLQLNVTKEVEREAAVLKARQLEERNAILDLERQQLLKLSEAKDDFISIASHQLRTPATAVKQYLGMLQQGFYGDMSEEQTRAVSVAYESNERQLNIIEDLLKTARLDSGKMALTTTDVDLVKLSNELIQEFEYRLLDHNQTIKIKAPSDPITVKGDYDLIKMAVENLFDNAIKYSHDNTTIHILISKKKSSVCYQITDQGIGISDKNSEKLFTKFTRIQSESTKNIGGTGLGLYWTKRVIDLHSGTINFSSKVDSGTTFTICLPLTQPKASTHSRRSDRMETLL